MIEIENLGIVFGSGKSQIAAVKNANMRVAEGESYGIVGESGSGKSTVLRAMVGIYSHWTGTIRIAGEPLRAKRSVASRKHMQMVFQDPYGSLHPRRTVDDTLSEPLIIHGLKNREDRVLKILQEVGLGPEFRFRYPHQLSGGQRQRVAIARALILDPRVILLDEPTSALDADRAQSVLAALRSLGAAVVLISHDIGLVLRHADRVGILHGGRLVEQGTPSALKARAEHPEPRRLLAALGTLPDRKNGGVASPILRMNRVSATYEKGRVAALKSADLAVSSGDIVGIQGPSGCGKSTLLRLAMGIEQPSTGTIWRADSLDRPGAILPVFQDPVGSLVPHWPIWRSVVEPLTVPGQRRLPRNEKRQRVAAALGTVGLADADPEARPSELSIGQSQRVALARATISEPALIVADAPTSALDSPSTWLVSRLLRDAADRGAAVLVVSHDSTFLDRLVDRVVRMDAGRTCAAEMAAQ